MLNVCEKEMPMVANRNTCLCFIVAKCVAADCFYKFGTNGTVKRFNVKRATKRNNDGIQNCFALRFLLNITAPF